MEFYQGTKPSAELTANAAEVSYATVSCPFGEYSVFVQHLKQPGGGEIGNGTIANQAVTQAPVLYNLPFNSTVEGAS